MNINESAKSIRLDYFSNKNNALDNTSLYCGERSLLEKINLKLDKIDAFFNIAGFIPAASSLTGILRIGYGTIEIITGIFLMLIGGFALAFGHRQPLVLGADHLIQGGLNVVRGTIDFIPLVGNGINFWIASDARLYRTYTASL